MIRLMINFYESYVTELGFKFSSSGFAIRSAAYCCMELGIRLCVVITISINDLYLYIAMPYYDVNLTDIYLVHSCHSWSVSRSANRATQDKLDARSQA